MPRKDYDRFLHKQLQDKTVAAEYLNAALENGSIHELLVALRNVVNAHGSIGELAKMAKLNRQSLYRMLSENGNPTLGSLLSLLKAVGLHLTFNPDHKKAA